MFQVIGGIASIVGTFTGAVEGDHHQQDTANTQVKQSSIPVEETKQQCDDSQHVEEWKGADCTVVVKDLMVFPCRGAQGIHLKEANILESGVEYDRHWFVLEKEFDINTDPNVDKRFVSLTKSELLGLVSCRFDQSYSLVDYVEYVLALVLLLLSIYYDLKQIERLMKICRINLLLISLQILDALN